MIGHTAGLSTYFGFNGYPDATGANSESYVFGDTGTGVEAFFGGALEQYAYHGMTLDLGEGGSIPARSTTEDWVVTLHNATSNITLSAGATSGNVTLAPGSSGKVLSSKTFSSSIASGSNAFEATANGARIDFGAGASDYASSDGTTVTFAGPLASASTVQGTALRLSSSLIAPVVTATGSGATTNQQGIETGTTTLSSGAATKTFSPAFTTSAPICTCTDTTAAAAVKCSTSTTTLTLAGTSTDAIAWICIGRK